jgi:hypothetical protein
MRMAIGSQQRTHVTDAVVDHLRGVGIDVERPHPALPQRGREFAKAFPQSGSESAKAIAQCGREN